MESTQNREPWNKGKLVGQKPPLKPKDITEGPPVSEAQTIARAIAALAH